MVTALGLGVNVISECQKLHLGFDDLLCLCVELRRSLHTFIKSLLSISLLYIQKLKEPETDLKHSHLTSSWLAFNSKTTKVFFVAKGRGKKNSGGDRAPNF